MPTKGLTKDHTIEDLGIAMPGAFHVVKQRGAQLGQSRGVIQLMVYPDEAAFDAGKDASDRVNVEMNNRDETLTFANYMRSSDYDSAPDALQAMVEGAYDYLLNESDQYANAEKVIV